MVVGTGMNGWGSIISYGVITNLANNKIVFAEQQDALYFLKDDYIVIRNLFPEQAYTIQIWITRDDGPISRNDVDKKIFNVIPYNREIEMPDTIIFSLKDQSHQGTRYQPQAGDYINVIIKSNSLPISSIKYILYEKEYKNNNSAIIIKEQSDKKDFIIYNTNNHGEYRIDIDSTIDITFNNLFPVSDRSAIYRFSLCYIRDQKTYTNLTLGDDNLSKLKIKENSQYKNGISIPIRQIGLIKGDQLIAIFQKDGSPKPLIKYSYKIIDEGLQVSTINTSISCQFDITPSKLLLQHYNAPLELLPTYSLLFHLSEREPSILSWFGFGFSFSGKGIDFPLTQYTILSNHSPVILSLTGSFGPQGK